jgi:hypothetical protein
VAAGTSASSDGSVAAPRLGARPAPPIGRGPGLS